MLFGKENGKGRAAEARTQGYPISDRPCLRDVLVTVGHQPVRREGSAPEGVTFPRIVGTAHLTMAAMATLPIMNERTLRRPCRQESNARPAPSSGLKQRRLMSAS